MKQEHAITPGVLVSDDMAAGDYKARCAVLEAEVAELRKRVCVPEGYVVVPVEPTEEMLGATSWPRCAATDYKHMLAALGSATHQCPQCAAALQDVSRLVIALEQIVKVAPVKGPLWYVSEQIVAARKHVAAYYDKITHLMHD